MLQWCFFLYIYKILTYKAALGLWNLDSVL